MNSECIYDVLFPVIGTECLAWVRARLSAKVNPSQRVEGAKRRGFLWGRHRQRGGGSAQSEGRHLLMRHGNLGRSRGKAASGRFRRIQKVEEEGKGKTPLPSVPVLTLVPNCFSPISRHGSLQPLSRLWIPEHPRLPCPILLADTLVSPREAAW